MKLRLRCTVNINKNLFHSEPSAIYYFQKRMSLSSNTNEVLFQNSSETNEKTSMLK